MSTRPSSSFGMDGVSKRIPIDTQNSRGGGEGGYNRIGAGATQPSPRAVPPKSKAPVI